MTSIKSTSLPKSRAQAERPASKLQKDITTQALTTTKAASDFKPAQSDSFDARSASSTELPSPALLANANVSGPLGTRVAVMGESRESLLLDLRSVENKLKLASKALPLSAQNDALKALKTSAERIIPAFDKHEISFAEAKSAIHMLSEMEGALVAIEQGHYTVKLSSEPGAADFKAYDVSTTDGDLIRVGARLTGSGNGQARLKFYNVLDNGQPVGKAQRIMIRFDLEGSELQSAPLKAAIDVQFGSEKTPAGQERLDNRIHGVLLGDDGNPILNRGGREIADHHFSAHFLSADHVQQAFRDFVDSFVEKLEAKQQSSAFSSLPLPETHDAETSQ